MKLRYEIEGSTLLMECKGKTTDAKSFIEFKKTLSNTLLANPQIKTIGITFDTFPLSTQILGLILKYINIDAYPIHIITSNYACFKTFEDLKLVEKFDVKYQKDEI
ncbi:hypothetical protein BBW65_06165 [Helicobacter enhydrae]|uniref:STAS domain-containing protein n=1 Tax=Helicobacter enhydrae TaxID=222136 RepID=A0A1B1U6I6_9HELI|nr:hypothetical protein [Helicobacter enhydrae]ANV98403.1 hypothetical protein BBW65_06165 [Helicobacter enhydrae]